MGRILTPDNNFSDPDPEPAEAPDRDRMIRLTARYLLQNMADPKNTIGRSFFRLIEDAHNLGHPELAFTLQLLEVAHLSCLTPVLAPMLDTIIGELIEAQECRLCGCTNEFACAEGCTWAEIDLCSACVKKAMLGDGQ